MKKFITDQSSEMMAAVDAIGFIQIGDDGESINTTAMNLLQLVAEKNPYAPVVKDWELARYETADRTRKAYDMFLDWLNADIGNTVFVFSIWDEEINDFNPSWNDQHKRQIPVVQTLYKAHIQLYSILMTSKQWGLTKTYRIVQFAPQY